MKTNNLSAAAILLLSFGAGVFGMLASISFLGPLTGSLWTGILASIGMIAFIYTAYTGLKEWGVPLRVD